ncbi:MAG: hypothetical protein ACI4QI_02685 [Candidatus Coproplasma sp.]
MAVEKKRIIIGREYAETFASAYKLLQTGRIKEVAAEAASDQLGRPIIVTPTHEYFCGNVRSVESSQAISMGKDGASWFKAIREGKSFDDGSSQWKALIEKIATQFHKQYSIIEYKRCGDNSASSKSFESGIKNVVERLFDLRSATIKKGMGDAGTQDIYGAFVKLDLCGAGQACYTVMCKIYFRRTGRNNIRPISSREAAVVNAMLENAPPNDEAVDTIAASVPDDTLTALDNLVKGVYNLKFKDCLCFSNRQTVNPETNVVEDNYDLKTFKRLISSAVHNNSAITCTAIKVMSISHVKWNNAYYDVYLSGKPVLRAVMGFGGSLSLRCLNCNGGEELIYSNTIDYSFVDENGNKINRSIVLDPERADLGLDEQAVEELKRYSRIADHLNKVFCQRVARTNNSCTAYVCSNQTITDGKSVKCANCPYPEEVYTDYSHGKAEHYFTSTLKFAVDRMAMVKKEEAAECNCCGRTFTKSVLPNGLCPLCADLSDLSEEKKIIAKKTYGKYRNVLSHTLRLKHLFHEKYCLEDDTIVLFALGTDRYVLSKFELNAGGYINSPKKIGKG